MLSSTIDMFMYAVDVEAISCGCRASASTTVHHGIVCCGGVNQDFGKVPKSAQTAIDVTM
jgi:hypothetical protein